MSTEPLRITLARQLSAIPPKDRMPTVRIFIKQYMDLPKGERYVSNLIDYLGTLLKNKKEFYGQTGL